MTDRAADPVAAQLERAATLVELRRWDEAKSTLAALIGSEPDVARAWGLMAQVQLALDDPKEALASAGRAASLDTDDEWPHRLRSVAFQALGDEAGAVSAAREGVAAAPHVWQAYARLAEALVFAERNPDEAVAAAGHAVELGPHQPYAFFALGQAYNLRGNDAEAEQCYKQALAIDPQHAASRDALARRDATRGGFFAKRGLGGAGDLANAATGFRDVVRANPRSGVAARNIEAVVRVFIGRLFYPIFLVAYASFLAKGGSVGQRLVPVVGLVIPAVYASRFLGRLAPDLRRRVWYFAFRGRLVVPSVLQSCAVGLLLVSVFAPEHARGPMCFAAWIASAGSRIVLFIEYRQRRRAAR